MHGTYFKTRWYIFRFLRLTVIAPLLMYLEEYKFYRCFDNVGDTIEGAFSFFLSFLAWPLPPTPCRCQVFCCIWSHSHTTPLDQGLAGRRGLYLTTHNNHRRQAFVPPVEFEPAIPGKEWPQTYALERAATGTGHLNSTYMIK